MKGNKGWVFRACSTTITNYFLPILIPRAITVSAFYKLCCPAHCQLCFILLFIVYICMRKINEDDDDHDLHRPPTSVRSTLSLRYYSRTISSSRYSCQFSGCLIPSAIPIDLPVCTGWPKNGTVFLVRLQILTDYQNYFTVRIRRKFAIILSLKIPPHLKCVATLPCKMSSVFKATMENKTTSVTNIFKKLTTWNNVFIVSVIV